MAVFALLLFYVVYAALAYPELLYGSESIHSGAEQVFEYFGMEYDLMAQTVLFGVGAVLVFFIVARYDFMLDAARDLNRKFRKVNADLAKMLLDAKKETENVRAEHYGLMAQLEELIEKAGALQKQPSVGDWVQDLLARAAGDSSGVKHANGGVHTLDADVEGEITASAPAVENGISELAEQEQHLDGLAARLQQVVAKLQEHAVLAARVEQKHADIAAQLKLLTDAKVSSKAESVKTFLGEVEDQISKHQVVAEDLARIEGRLARVESGLSVHVGAENSTFERMRSAERLKTRLVDRLKLLQGDNHLPGRIEKLWKETSALENEVDKIDPDVARERISALEVRLAAVRVLLTGQDPGPALVPQAA
jgi:DNA repair exonuclease SbcCD ATPase subunit